MKHHLAPRRVLSLVVGLIAISVLAASPASAEPFVSPSCHAGDPLCAAEESALARTPFSAKENAAALPELMHGKTVRRSVADGSATAQDRASLHGLGAQSLHAGVVLMHKIPKRNEAQLKRLRALVSAVDGFAPSGACDEIVREGNGSGLCAGTADGPLGKVKVRIR